MTETPQNNTPQPGETLRGKWLMDGATTLDEAAERLEAEARRLRDLAVQGWTLNAPIADDYGFLVDPSGDGGPREYEDGSGELDEDDASTN